MNAASPSASATRLSSAPATQPCPKREKESDQTPLRAADHAARLKVDDVRVSLALALGKLDRRGEFYLVGSPTDRFCQACGEAEDLHRRICVPGTAQFVLGTQRPAASVLSSGRDPARTLHVANVVARRRQPPKSQRWCGPSA